jgi:hypothetical protein
MSATTANEILRRQAQLEAEYLRERQKRQALDIVEARARARTLHKTLAKRVASHSYYIECEARISPEGMAAFEQAWRDSSDERASRFKRKRRRTAE